MRRQLKRDPRLLTAATLGGLGGLVAAEAEVSEGYIVAFGAVDRDCGWCMNDIEGYAWRVGGAAAEAAAGHTGNIGMIASLCSLRGRRHSLYAFVTRDPHLDPGGWPCEWPCEPCLGVQLCIIRGFTTLACAARPKAACPVLSSASQSIYSVLLSCPDEV